MAHPEPHPHCSASLQCSAWHTSQQPSSSHEQIGSVDMAKVRFLTDTVKDHQQTWTGICSKLNLSFLISSGKSFFGKLSPSLDQRLYTVPYWVLFRFTISVRTFNLIFQLVLIHFWKKKKNPGVHTVLNYNLGPDSGWTFSQHRKSTAQLRVPLLDDQYIIYRFKPLMQKESLSKWFRASELIKC